jgi:hypothetical protein
MDSFHLAPAIFAPGMAYNHKYAQQISQCGQEDQAYWKKKELVL